jgi:hypothetical protein
MTMGDDGRGCALIRPKKRFSASALSPGDLVLSRPGRTRLPLLKTPEAGYHRPIKPPGIGECRLDDQKREFARRYRGIPDAIGIVEIGKSGLRMKRAMRLGNY